MTLGTTGYCQNVGSQHFSIEMGKSVNPKMILISGIVLDSDSIKPIENLPPLITYLNWNATERDKFLYVKDGVYENGSFSFYLPSGKYKFMCSQLGYSEILTDWIKIKENDIGLIFLIEKYKSGSFH